MSQNSIDHEAQQLTPDDLRDAVRAAIEDRATWFYLLIKELNGGSEIQEQEFASRAIFKFGQIRGEGMKPARTPVEWAEKLITPVGRLVFEQELVEKGEDRAVLEFSYCPLVQAWRRLAATEDEVARLCRMARCGDNGRISPFDLDLQFEGLLAEGNDRCRLVVTAKPKLSSGTVS